MQMRALSAACPAEEQPSRQLALMHTLLHWAAQQQAWQQVIALPLSVPEEQALLTCTRERGPLQPALALHLGLYFLLRGRLLEASSAVRDLDAAHRGKALQPIRAFVHCGGSMQALCVLTRGPAVQAS